MSISSPKDYRSTLSVEQRAKLVVTASVAAALLLAAPAAFAGAATRWYASRSPVAKTNWLYANDTCAHGSADCNRCAPDVEAQWSDMASGALSWRERSWHFGWDRGPQPSGITPNQAWDVGGPSLWDYKSHAQGFVRTNHPTVKYAMSHGDDEYGSLTFINSSNNIYALHRTFSTHPSGIFALGQYVGMVDSTDIVRFFDTRRALESHNLSFRMGAAEAGGPGVRDGNGGLAMAKLHGGGYLFVVGQGGISNPSQDTYLFFVDGPLTAPHRRQYLGTIPYVGGAGQSENISLITECGTRQIYTVHIAGDDALEGNGWYRLSKLMWGANGPWLWTWDVKWVRQHSGYCHHRSAASASVRDDGTFDLYCHERAEDNGAFSGPGDDWEFREGLNYSNW
jgi:hypothetical protein